MWGNSKNGVDELAHGSDETWIDDQQSPAGPQYATHFAQCIHGPEEVMEYPGQGDDVKGFIFPGQ
jgi:hypothetical protein